MIYSLCRISMAVWLGAARWMHKLLWIYAYPYNSWEHWWLGVWAVETEKADYAISQLATRSCLASSVVLAKTRYFVILLNPHSTNTIKTTTAPKV